MPLKENRKIKLLETAGSTLQALGSPGLAEDRPYLARLDGVPSDVSVPKLVFLLTRMYLAGCSQLRHEDGHQDVLFLCSSEAGLTPEEIRLGYQKRWPVEEQHKSDKQNTGLGLSPASLMVARVNHVFCSFLGVLKVGYLKLKTGLNHFALKAKLSLKAVQAAQTE